MVSSRTTAPSPGPRATSARKGSGKGSGQGSRRGSATGSKLPPRQIALLVLLTVGLLVSVGSNIRSGQLDAMDGLSATEARAAELRAEEAVRDRDQIVALTLHARQLRDALMPLLDDLGRALPPGATPAADLDVPEEVLGAWTDLAGAALASFEQAPSGSTETNVARGSLANAVELLDGVTRTVENALAVDDRAVRRDLLAQASEQRDLAVRTWSVGATQLDKLNVDAGNGHQHVFLEVDGTGAMTPDDTPEGELPDG